MVDIAATKSISSVGGGDLLNAAASSIWRLMYHHTESAFSQMFALFNQDWIKGHHCEYGVIRRTHSGPVRGKTFILKPDQRRVNAFLGIPYALAGTFSDRFKKPFPVVPWTEPLDCTQFGPRAVQHDMFWDTYITPIRQDEAGCLCINVFAPDWESEEFKHSGRPVMVFVHGGGFLIHSAVNYGDWNICQNLCPFDVVVCVIQYRLGAFGFFSTGDERCPGNFGLWDQLAAFRWIKENISAFGGDPQNVTAFGQSAGAASIDLLSLSPHSKGLFKRIILMGGNGCTDWALAKPERTQQAAIKLARRAGWKGMDGDLDSLLAFLRAVPAYKIAASLIGKSAFNRHKKGLDFCPVIDGDLIPKCPEEMRREMDWPLEVIIGGCEFEALLFVALGRNQANIASMRKCLDIYIPSQIPRAEELRREGEAFYLEDVDIRDPQQVARAFLKLHSDLMMNNSVQRYCRSMSASGRHRIYLYNMTYFNKDGFGFVGLRMPFYASTHCHDVRYLLGKGLYAKFRPNWDDKQMMRIIGSLFTNFAKFGNPNTHWTNSEKQKENLDENANKTKELMSAEQSPPWHNHFSANSVLISPPLWSPISADDPSRHLEISLDPTPQGYYQDNRYAQFWAKIDQQLAKLPK